MKNIFKKILSASLSALLIASSTSISFAGTNDEDCAGVAPMDELVLYAHLGPTAVKLYKDSERIEQITSKDDIPLGEKVYYSLESQDGYRVLEFKVNAEYIDTDYMILSDTDFQFEPVSVLAGDFDNNGKVNSKDAMWILRYCAYWHEMDDLWTIEENLLAGDYNYDGYVDMRDAAGILRMLVELDESYGGIQEDFEAVGVVEYEAAEQIATSWERGDKRESAFVIASAADFKAYWDEANTEILYSDEYNDAFRHGKDPHAYHVNEKYPLDKEALCAKYNDEFFAEYNIVIGCVHTYEIPESKFDSFKFVNGVPTVEFHVPFSGMASQPSYNLRQLIIVDKDAVPADAEIECREIIEYGTC